MSGSLGGKVSTDIALVTIMNVARKARSFFLIPLVVVAAGISSYGTYIQVVTLVSVLSFILTIGAPSGFVRFLQKSETDDAVLYYSLMFLVTPLGVLGGVFVYIFSDFLSVTLLNTSDRGELFVAAATLIPIRVLFRMVDGYFRSHMRTKTASVLLTLRMYLSFAAVGVSLYLLRVSILGAIVAMTIAEGALTVLMIVVITSSIGLGRPQLDTARQVLAFSLPMTVSDIATDLSTRVDRLFVGSFLGADVVGVYDIAYRVASVVMIYSQPISRSLFPEFSRLVEDGKIDHCVTYTRRAARYYTILIVPSIFGLALVGDDVSGLVTGGQVSDQAATLIPLIAAGLAFWGVDHVYSNALFANKNTALMMSIRTTGALLNIGLNLILIPTLGVLGAAAATFGSYFVAAFLVFIYSNRVIPAGANLTIVGKSLAAATVMYATGWTILSESLILSLVLLPIIYFLVLLLIGGISITEAEAAGIRFLS